MAEFDDITQAIADAIQAAEIAGLKRYEGLIKQRVHNRGRKSDDNSIGVYGAAYAKYRKKRGRQVAYVDLELEGDLRRSYTVGVTEDAGTNALGFVNDFETEKAIKHESRYGPVFAPTAGEDQEADKSYVAILNKVIADALG